MNGRIVPTVISLILFFHCCNGTFHKFSSGECPQISPMPGFNIERFLGQWYVLENYNDIPVTCLRENFTLINEEECKKDMFDMARNELETGKTVDQQPIYNVVRTYLSFGGREIMNESGKIKFLSNNSQAEMEINFPYTETGMLNLKHYQVIATDYDRYAVVWRCQRTIFGHRRSAQIMSRKMTIESKTLIELKAMLKQFDVERMTEISQVNCSPKSFQDEVLEDEKIPNKNDKPNRVKPIEEKPGKAPIEILIPEKIGKNNKKKLLSVDVGGFHLSIHFPFW